MYRLKWRKLRLSQLLFMAVFCLPSSSILADDAELNPWFSATFYRAKPLYLADVKLSVEQEESLFKLLHAQLPAIKELQTERLDAAHAVQAQALVHNYDREQLDPMIERLAKAVVAEHIQRAEIDNRIVSLLTPAQREQVVNWWQQREQISTAIDGNEDTVKEADSIKK